MRELLKAIKNNVMKYHYEKNSDLELLCDQEFYDDIKLICVNQLDLEKNNANIFLKNSPGDTTTVAIVAASDQQYVVKRYNIKGLIHGIKIQFRKSHAFRSFAYATFLAQSNIPTIKPIAVIQRKIGKFKLESYFISQYIEGIRGCEYFSDDSSYQEAWPKAIAEINQLITKMRENLIYHGDFHFGNLLINNNHPILLDFDRIKKVNNKKRFDYLHQKDLKNFYRYLVRNSRALKAFQL